MFHSYKPRKRKTTLEVEQDSKCSTPKGNLIQVWWKERHTNRHILQGCSNISDKGMSAELWGILKEIRL